MTLSDDLEHIGEHIGDDQPNLPEGSKNTLLRAAKALRESDRIIDGYKTWVDEQDDRIKELEAKFKRLERIADELLNHCDKDGGECGECGRIVCDHNDPMHFHHDGCPSCIILPARVGDYPQPTRSQS